MQLLQICKKEPHLLAGGNQSYTVSRCLPPNVTNPFPTQKKIQEGGLVNFVAKKGNKFCLQQDQSNVSYMVLVIKSVSSRTSVLILTHSDTHPLTHPLAHLLTHLLTHSRIH